MLEKLPLKNINWEQHVPLIAKAHSQLARFDEMLLADQEKLLPNLFTAEEAVFSLRLDGYLASLKEALAGETGLTAEPSAVYIMQAIKSYKQALQYAAENLTKAPLTLNLLKETHKILQPAASWQAAQKKMPTAEQTSTTESQDTPSLIELLEYLSNFEYYFQFNDKEQLVQLAVIYAQFAKLHPFVDGNGLIGRLLVPLFLYHKQLMCSPSFCISPFFEQHKDEYARHLKNTTKTWDGWIEFFLQALIAQAKAQNKRAKTILDLYARTHSQMTQLMRPKLAKQILDFIFASPMFKGASFVKFSHIPKATASRLLNALVSSHILTPVREKTGRAGQIYHFDQLVDILSDI